MRQRYSRAPFIEEAYKILVETWNEELGMTTELGPYNAPVAEVLELVQDINFHKVRGFDKARIVVR